MRGNCGPEYWESVARDESDAIRNRDNNRRTEERHRLIDHLTHENEKLKQQTQALEDEVKGLLCENGKLSIRLSNLSTVSSDALNKRLEEENEYLNKQVLFLQNKLGIEPRAAGRVI